LGTTEEIPSGSPEEPPSEAGRPLVSVIVPTFNRADLLGHLLGALAEQAYPSSLLELIVVDNSSTDGTAELVERWSKVMGYPVRFVRKQNEGPVASRNLGASQARGRVLAFTDSDCVPDPRWVLNAVHYLTGNPDVSIVCGPMRALGSEGAGLLDAQHEETIRDTGLYPSGNLIFRRECFERAGGFDEQFGIYPWGALVRGEDTDLVWRARRLGYRAEFVDDVAVGHLPAAAPPLGKFLLQPLVVQIVPRLVRSIPELRETFLWHRYFMARDHALFYLAFWGAIQGARKKKPGHLLWAAPWLWEIRGMVRNEYRRGGPTAALKSVVLLAQHLVACALVLVYASIRYRRLVL